MPSGLTHQLQQLCLSSSGSRPPLPLLQPQPARQDLQTQDPQPQYAEQLEVLQQGVSTLSAAAFFGVFFRRGPSSGVYELFDSLLQVRARTHVERGA